jgi:acyl dehydratase
MPLFSEIEVGVKIPPVKIKMDWPMYKTYNRFVREINPLHFNEKYAKSLGYKGIVVAGVFTYSFFIRPIVKWIQDPTSIKQIKIRYHNPVYIGDEVIQGATITKKYVKEGINYLECDIWAENQNKQELMSGSGVIILKS